MSGTITITILLVYPLLVLITQSKLKQAKNIIYASFIALHSGLNDELWPVFGWLQHFRQSNRRGMSKKEVAFLKRQVISNVAFLTTQQITDTQTVSVQFVIQCFSQLDVHSCFISQGEQRMSDNHSGMQERHGRRGKREIIFRQSF